LKDAEKDDSTAAPGSARRRRGVSLHLLDDMARIVDDPAPLDLETFCNEKQVRLLDPVGQTCFQRLAFAPMG